MKKIFVFIVLVCSCTFLFSQQDTTKKEEVFTIVESMPLFPGGNTTMMNWISAKIGEIGFPENERKAEISGTCYVTFIIDKEGNVTDPKILRGVTYGPGYDRVALQVVKAMPQWAPGKQNGREVSVQYNLPIKFTILRPEEQKEINESRIFYNKGVEFANNNNYEKAFEEFNKSLDILPTNITTLYNRGVLFLKLDKKEEACKDWNKIKSLGKPDADKLIKEYCQ
ncbi:MAG: TonB family protein [Bacteroidota bacterium]